MTLTARIKANRENARLSTGPRSEAGKRRAATNALRHSLAVPIASLPEVDARSRKLARLIAGEDSDHDRLGFAQRIADAQIDLSRVRRARMALLERPLEPRIRHTEKETMTLMQLAKKALDGDENPILSEQLKQMSEPPASRQMNEYKHFVAVISDRSKELKRFDRYERRALSRRKFAIREMDSL